MCGKGIIYHIAGGDSGWPPRASRSRCHRHQEGESSSNPSNSRWETSSHLLAYPLKKEEVGKGASQDIAQKSPVHPQGTSFFVDIRRRSLVMSINPEFL